MNREIDVQALMSEIIRKWWLITISAIIFGCTFFCVSKFAITEMFESYGSIYVNSKSQEIISLSQDTTANLYELTTAAKLVDTYKAILMSNNFLNMVQNEADINYTIGSMKTMLRYENIEETGIINVYATAPTPKEAHKLCKAILDNANAGIESIVEVGSVKIVDNATMPTSKSYPSNTKNGLLGIVIGTALSCSFIFLRFIYDVKIKKAEDIESKYELVVLGSIPDMLSERSSRNGGGRYGRYGKTYY